MFQSFPSKPKPEKEMQQVSDNPLRVGDEDYGQPSMFRRTNDEDRIDFYQEVTDRERGRYIDMDSVRWPHEIVEAQEVAEKLDAMVDNLFRSSLKNMTAREKNRVFGYIRGVE
jgi:hypothetical protein